MELKCSAELYHFSFVDSNASSTLKARTMSAQRERFVGETFVFDRDNHSLPRAHSGLESSRGDRVQISEPIYGAPGVFENLEINPAAAIRAKFFRFSQSSTRRRKVAKHVCDCITETFCLFFHLLSSPQETFSIFFFFDKTSPRRRFRGINTPPSMAMCNKFSRA